MREHTTLPPDRFSQNARPLQGRGERAREKGEWVGEGMGKCRGQGRVTQGRGGVRKEEGYGVRKWGFFLHASWRRIRRPWRTKRLA
jgi:hypothetical protein